MWRRRDDDRVGIGLRERRVEGNALRQKRGGKRMSDGREKGDLDDQVNHCSLS